LRADFRHQGISLLLVRTFLEKHLGRLCYYDTDQKLDDLAAEIRRWRMEEVLVDVCQHPSTSPEVVERALQALRVRSALRSRNGGMCDSNLKKDGGLLIRNGSLCY